MLPNKLSPDKPQFPSFIVDENYKPICTVISVGKNALTKQEIIKRYNGYNKLKIALIVVSSALVIVLYAYIKIISYMLL